MAVLATFLWLPLFKCIAVGVVGAVFVDDDVAAAKVAQTLEQAVECFLFKFC